MTIGERIAARRTELGMTQEELATKLGYKSRSSINKIETGVNELTQKKIIAFANALETTPEYIMGWEELGDIHKNIMNTSADVIRLTEKLMVAQQQSLPTEMIESIKSLTDENLKKLNEMLELLIISQKAKQKEKIEAQNGK